MKKFQFLLAIFVIINFATDAHSATTYYEVWRNTTDNPNTAARIKQWLTTTSYEDNDPAIVPQQPYYYWIRAISCEYIETPGYVGSSGLGYNLTMLYPTSATSGYTSPLKLSAQLWGSYFGSTDESIEFFMAEMDDVSFYDVIEPSWFDYFNSNLTANWNKDTDISSYSDWGQAEIRFVFTVDFFLGLDSWGKTDEVYVNLQDSPSIGPASSATQGIYSDKIVVSWNAMTNTCSEIDVTPLCQGWTRRVYPPDITGDGYVNLMDFAILAANWLRTDCGVSNDWCNQADIDRSNEVSFEDISLMAEHWLEEIDAATGIIWVSIDDPGIGGGHEGFSGQMSKYETTNAQYCQFLNAAIASGDITVSGNYIYGANGSNNGMDFAGQKYYYLAGTGYTYDGATNGGAARINYTGGVFTVDSGFENHPVTYVSWYGSTAFCNYYGYRLPTEWEWQAVADFDGSFLYGCGTSINNNIANYYGSTHPYGTSIVGVFGTYGYGMADMAGNVWEWTTSAVFRGGSWYDYGNGCSVSYRYDDYFRYTTVGYIGFRVCR